MKQMPDEALVFYCKKCGVLFFAVVNDPNLIKGCADEIASYIANGDRMNIVDTTKVKVRFGHCACYDGKENLRETLPLLTLLEELNDGHQQQ